MNEISSRQSHFERLRAWLRARDLRGPIAIGAVGAVVVGSLTIVGVASAQNGNGFFGLQPTTSKEPLATTCRRMARSRSSRPSKPKESPATGADQDRGADRRRRLPR